jgi:hypothetical protein
MEHIVSEWNQLLCGAEAEFVGVSRALSDTSKPTEVSDD